MITIKIFPKRSKLLGEISRDIIDFIDNATSAYVKNYQFSSLFRQKRKDGSRVWDGKMHLFSRATNSFPTGVLDIVCEVLDKCKIQYTLDKDPDVFLPGIPCTIPTVFGPYTLYDYQEEAIKTFLSDRGYLPCRGIIRVATGGGKTLIGAAIARILDLPTLVLVHGKKLVRQNYETFKQVFDEEVDKIGLVDADNFDIQQVTVASTDTLYSRLSKADEDSEIFNWLQTVKFIIADECHRATSKSFADIIKASEAPVRLGLSGTPNKKEDDRDLLLHSLTGRILYTMSVPQLKAANTISKAHLLCVTVSRPKIDNLEWPDAFETCIVNNVYRHKLIAELVRQRFEEDKTMLVLAGGSLALAENLYNHIAKLIPKRKIKLVNGLSQNELVDKAFDGLKHKRLSVVVTTTIADEGVDIPAINGLFLAGGGQSFTRTVQRVGRVLRKKLDGSDAEIIDILDTTNPYLKKHALKRLLYYEEESLFDSVKMVKAHEIFPEDLDANTEKS